MTTTKTTTKPAGGERPALAITRATPEIVKYRGMGAIRDWQATDRPWIKTYGCSYHGFRQTRKRPNVAGFWAKRGQTYIFRALATLPVMSQWNGNLVNP